MPDIITPSERRLIDEAIQAGRVTKIPTGKVTFAGYTWDEKTRRVSRVDKKPPSETFNAAATVARDKLNKARAETAAKRRAVAVEMLRAGKTRRQIATAIGISYNTAKDIVYEAIKRGEWVE